MTPKKLTAVLLLLTAGFAAAAGEKILAKQGRIFRKRLAQAVEERVSSQFGLRIGVGRLEGGFFRNLAAADLSVVDPKDPDHPILEAKRVIFGCRLWPVFLKKPIHVRKVRILSPRVQWRPLAALVVGRPVEGRGVRILIEDGEVSLFGEEIAARGVSGEVEIWPRQIVWRDVRARILEGEIETEGRAVFGESGTRLRAELHASGKFGEARLRLKDFAGWSSLRGSIKLKEDRELTFSGEWTFADRTVRIPTFVWSSREHPSPITLAGLALTLDYAQLPDVSVSASVDQTWDGNFSVRTDLVARSRVDFEKPAGSGLGLELSTRGLFVNGERFPDLEASVQLKGLEWNLSFFRWGNAVRGYGKGNLAPPFSTSGLVKLENLSLDRLVASMENKDFSGDLSGQFEWSGSPESPKIKGVLSSGRGHAGSLAYEGGTISLQGAFPILRVTDSRVNLKDGYLVFEGEVDVAGVGTPSLYEGLRLRSHLGDVVWEGWRSRIGSRRPRMSFRSWMGEAGASFSSRILQGRGALTDSPTEGAVPVGLEHKVRF